MWYKTGRISTRDFTVYAENLYQKAVAKSLHTVVFISVDPNLILVHKIVKSPQNSSSVTLLYLKMGIYVPYSCEH